MSDESAETPLRRASDAAIATLTERVAGLGDKVQTFRDDLCARLSKIEEGLAGSYVTQGEFRPVRSIVFGGVALILTAVAGALVALVVVK